MGLLRELNKIRGGWPGGWKEFARGYGGQRDTPPFVQPENPDDRRSLISPLGLKEYWYPALPAKDIGWKKPVGLKIAGDELVFFRDKDGEVQALWDYCPHRGAYLSWGDCFWKGFVSCPYHGATFDGNGECVEFITEGPDSKMVGRVAAKKYPTITLKGIVFVWMGEGEAVDPEEDIPPEFFTDSVTQVLHTMRYWDCNWMIALENTSDAHNAFWVHRNAFRVMFSARGDLGGRARTPMGYRSENVDNKSVRVVDNQKTAGYYRDENGNVPYQMYYPRIDGKWPLHRWRLTWVWAFKAAAKLQKFKQFKTPEEWQGMRLPGMQRLGPVGGPESMYTRWCVPVEKDLTRVVYFYAREVKTKAGRSWNRFAFNLYRNWLGHYNFSDQDYDAMRSCRYQYPEFLSATDSHVVAERRLITEHARGLSKKIAVNDVTTAELQVTEGHDLLGVRSEADYGQLEGIKVEVAAGSAES